MAEKQCTKCGETKPESAFKPKKRPCRDCLNAHDRSRRAAGLYCVDPEKRAARHARAWAKRKFAKHWRRPAERERRIVDKRLRRERKAAEQGRVLGPPRPPRSQEARLAERSEQEARKAWRLWLQNCPNWWLRAYYRATGKPWNNPRLSATEKWRIRYWLDPDFRAREIEKAQVLKVKRRQRIEANSDGTLTGAVIVSLFRNATHCIYCAKQMRSVEKSLDHVVPLSAGGAHSIHNVVVCCKSCNFRKGRKTEARFRCADTTSSISTGLQCMSVADGAAGRNLMESMGWVPV